jgi:hypothetical protein
MVGQAGKFCLNSYGDLGERRASEFNISELSPASSLLEFNQRGVMNWRGAKDSDFRLRKKIVAPTMFRHNS